MVGNVLKSEIWREQLYSLASGGCTVAEHSPHQPGVKGSSSAAAGSAKAKVCPWLLPFDLCSISLTLYNALPVVSYPSLRGILTKGEKD
jgi:hypothetical protein